MSLSKTQAVINGLRARGIVVHEWAGWATRTAPGTTVGSTDFVGGIVHHTGSAYGSAYAALVNGRGAPNPLAGPLCNFAGNADGSITVIAAGVANHAGASGGRSMGPLPVTGSFNRRVMGLEIVYPGVSPMTAAQYRAATVWARVVADVCGGGNIECIRAHAETSVTGKWDPGYADGRTIDMARFRRDSINPTEVDVNLTDSMNAYVYGGSSETVGSMLANTWSFSQQAKNLAADANTRVNEVKASVAQLAAKVDALLARPAADVDEVALAQALVAAGLTSGASVEEVREVVRGVFRKAGEEN